MFGLFRTATFTDEELGPFQRSGGLWRGRLRLSGDAPSPLVLSGSREKPDAEALNLARSIPAEVPGWRPELDAALFEHYQPYADAVAAGEEPPPAAAMPDVREPAHLWPHTAIEFVQVAPLDGQLTVEIGLRVAWDDEHTLGARWRDGRFIGLNGSVLAP
jgi:hypothetical protein